MAKKKLSKKSNRQKGELKTSEPRKALIKKFLYLVIVFVLILGTCFLLRNSSYFRLDSIEVIDRNRATRFDGSELLKIYKGRNIFDIDIDALSSRIEKDFPVIKAAIVKRTLPSSLQIDIIPRVPIAKIKTYEYFPIDRTGMVLSPEIKSKELPIIIGLSMWLRPQPGQSLKNRQLESAFMLIDALKESSISLDYNVTTIDISNHNNLSFYLENGIEVKMGGEDFSNRLKILESTLKTPSLDKENIKYIDLRFKDVVIGPK